MGKRGAATPKRGASKKAKVDAVFETVSNAVMESEQVPEGIRSMLVEMLPLSLTYASDERHKLQAMVVNFAEETLTGKKSALHAAVEADKSALSALQASESQLGSTVTQSTSALATQNEVVSTKAAALANAMEAEATSKTNLAELTSAQKEAEEKFAFMKEEHTELTAASAAHLSVIMEEGGKGPLKQLEPCLKKVDIESSLLQALPTSCGKAKDKRGTFDNVVLQSLKEAFDTKVASLGAAIEAEGPASAQREAAMQAATGDLSSKTAAREQANLECESAGKEKEEREAALVKAKAAVDNFQVNVQEATTKGRHLQALLRDFVAGPFANFTSLKERIAAIPAEEAPVEAEVAPAAVAEEPVVTTEA